MKLEGLGPGGIEPLKTGLKSSNPQVRFFCAEALAYLNDTSGVDTLGETVVHQNRTSGPMRWRPWRPWTSQRLISSCAN